MSWTAAKSTTTNRMATLAALLALLLAASVAPATHAAAAERRFADPVGDTSARSDIRWVEVTHSRARDLLKVRVGLTQVVYGAELTVYVDRRPSNPGPEWKMVANPDSEWALFRVRNWRDAGVERPCPGTVSYSKFTDRPIAVWKADRSCLRLGKKVGIAVRVQDAGFGTDWAPATRTFFPGIRAGG